MRRRRVVRVSRALSALLTAVAGVWMFAVATPTTAHAADPTAQVSITLTSVKPALPSRDGTISLTGRVTNVTETPLDNLQVIFWRSRDPILTEEALGRALESAADDPIGERVYRRDYQNIPSEENRVLGPGKSAAFSITTAVANLDLPAADGVYLFGVQVRGRLSADLGDQTLGRSRIFLPVVEDTPKTTLAMTSLVVLNSRPSLVRPGVLSDDHLATEVGATGRLTALLSAAEGDQVSFAVDPALIAELETMRQGYQVQGGDGGSGQAAATQWLERFARLESAHDGYRLLYGSPDLAALVHGDHDDALKAVKAAGAGVASTRALPLLVLPANGAADQATVDAAEDLDPAAILLADTSTQLGTPLLAGPGKAPIVGYSSAASGGGPGPDPRSTSVHLQQRLLASSWIEASNAVEGTTHGRVNLVTTKAQAKGDDAAVDAPWMQRSALSDLLKTTPATWDQNFTYPAGAQAAELSPAQLRRLDHFGLSLRTYADLLVDGDAARLDGNAAVARAASSTWRRQNTEHDSWLDPQQAALDEILATKVQISSLQRVSTVAQEGVVFPITIKNTLAASEVDPDLNAVKVRLEFSSDNTRRLNIKTIDAPVIQAGSSATEIAEVTAKANGTVPVTAQLITESGLKVGKPITIEVKVTQNGTTGWAIAIAAGLVLAGTTFLRIRQVTRERAQAEVAADTEPVDALSSAPPADVQAAHPAEHRDGFDA